MDFHARVAEFESGLIDSLSNLVLICQIQFLIRFDQLFNFLFFNPTQTGCLASFRSYQIDLLVRSKSENIGCCEEIQEVVWYVGEDIDAVSVGKESAWYGVGI